MTADVSTGDAVAPPLSQSLAGVRVLECGLRTGAAVCGSILADLGADVTVLEVERERGVTLDRSDKRRWRDRTMAGKSSLAWRAGDATARKLAQRVDVIIVSSDRDGARFDAALASVGSHAVICDITAYGSTGPCVGRPDDEARLQARLGIQETTGFSDGPPISIALPILETMTGIAAAGGALMALRSAARDGVGQRVEAALYDNGFAAMSSFFARALVRQGGPATRRLGNRHSLSAPWNAFETRDGWLLICTGSDEQWRRLCDVMDQPSLALDARFARSRDRVAEVEQIDAFVSAWTSSRSSAECVDVLSASQIPCGPIAPIDGHPVEPNLEHRRARRPGLAPDGGALQLPTSPLWSGRADLAQQVVVPSRDGGRSSIEAALGIDIAIDDSGTRKPAHATARDAALAGLRVIEIGHYTTAPVCARTLAAFGAEVIKIEPPAGEASRGWSPHLHEQSVFFTVSNSDKLDVVLDLALTADRTALSALLQTADVLVENLKPGSLAKHGFGAADLARRHPRLVYCAISGFGAESIYASRPAFDTVVQGMSGLMWAIGGAEAPVKSGMSSADVMGAGMATVAIVAALAERERTGRGQAIDLSMQDVVAWATQFAWDDAEAGAHDGLVQRDGGRHVLRQPGRDDQPVASLDDAFDDPCARERGLALDLLDDRGSWPGLAVPIRLSATPACVRRPGPALGADTEHVLSIIQKKALA